LLSSLSTSPSASISGIDPDGDRWTIVLLGPGTMNIVDPNGVAFTRANANVPAEIHTITVSGTFTSQSRLVGRVVKGPNSDGRVFFQQLNILPTAAYASLDTNAEGTPLTQPQNGIGAVDLPNFWLGRTDTDRPSTSSPLHSGFFLAGGITAPDGINVLRFGGVDVRYTTPGGVPLVDTQQRNEFVVNLGLPVILGTSIIVDSVITDAGVIPATGTAPPTPVQQSVTFLVAGRLNLFQANEILGNAAPSLIPTQFLDEPPAAPQPGGTFVVSQGGFVTGAIGNIRIGGNATNLTAFVIGNDITAPPQDGLLDPRLSNFFIGGETNNVILVTPGGSRNVYFGRGMDRTKISTEFIQNLQANRGAVSSAVTVRRTIGNMIMGGDVIDTLIQSGYNQNLASVANSPSFGFTPGGGVFNGVPVPTIRNRVRSAQGINLPLAHGGGQIHGRIAGNVINSVISVSVDPDPSGLNDPGQFQRVTSKIFPFGAPENIVLPNGLISVKVEGLIDNSGIQSGPNQLVDPNIPSTSAFFAKRVLLERGPVIPPNVPEAPYPRPTVYHEGQSPLQGLFGFNPFRRERRR
jgi:hypothetical protein